jgi:hypothetical protein
MTNPIDTLALCIAVAVMLGVVVLWLSAEPLDKPRNARNRPPPVDEPTGGGRAGPTGEGGLARR